MDSAGQMRSGRAQLTEQGSSSTPPAKAGEISPITVANMLLRHLRLMIAVPLIAVVLAVAIYVFKPPAYTAESKFIPQLAEQNASRLSGLAQQFGVNMGNATRGESLQLYSALLESRDLLRAAALKQYSLPHPNGGAGVFEGSLVGYHAELGEFSAQDTQRVVRSLQNRIRTTIDPAAGLITLQTEADSPELAEQLNRNLLELLNEFNLERRQSQASAERAFVESRMNSSAAELQAAERELKRFLEQNRSFQQSPELSFEASRYEQQLALRQQLYASLAQAFEQARIEEVRNTPVITIIDRPEGSARSAGPGIAVPVALSLLFGTALALGVVLTGEYIRTLRRENHDEIQEMATLGRRILPDRMRHYFR